MNNWQEFKASEHFCLVQNKDIDLKLFNGKIISVYQVVGVTLLDNKNNEVSYKDIGWFCVKKDYNRYKKLQKHHELLEKYNFENLDNFEFAIYDTYTEQEDRDKITKLFKKLKNHIEKAQEQILIESKTYL